MRICILTHTFPRFETDVAAPFMDGVAEGIAEAGNEVFVLTPFSPGFRSIPNRKYRVLTYKYIFPNSLHKLGYSQTLSNDKKLKISVYFFSPLMFFFGTVALIRLVLKEKIEIINAHWILPNGFLASLASLLTGVPVVSTLPGSDVLMVKKNVLFRAVAIFTTWKSKVVTSNSPQLLKDLRQETGVRFKSETIIYGVYPDKFKPDRSQTVVLKKKHSIPQKDVVIIGTGRLVEKKGFRYLVEAAPLVVKKYPNTTFVIVGDGDQRQELEKLAQKLKVDKNFRFVGTVDYKNLVHYYNLGDIFALPSVRDESGNLDDQSVAAVEAMACGLPIITTNFPGYAIVVKDGVNGFLTSEKDYKAISRALEKLVASSLLRKKMGQKSRELVLDHFSWKVIGKEYDKLFRQILGNF